MARTGKKTLLFVMLFLFCADPTRCDRNKMSFKRQRGYRITRVYSTNTVRSSIRCAGLCYQDNQCLSVNYHSDSRTCELNDRYFSDPAITPQPSGDWDVLDLYAGPEGWVRNGQWEYKAVQTKMAWHDAKANCESMSAFLSDVGDGAENQLLHDSIAEDCLWIGASDNQQEGDWRWLGGRPVSSGFEEWEFLQPDNFLGLEDCAKSCKFPFLHFWNDANCNEQASSVCKRRL